jgi:membrane-associated phospholipid phosphatase
VRPIISAVLGLILLVAPCTYAQDTTAADEPAGGVVQTSSDPAQQNPPAAAGEGAKPTRGFFSSLGHNLGDDVKHIPRRNSVYWLAGGIGLAYAVHPIDKSFNQHLIGHSNPFVAGEAIGELPTILGAGFAAYIYGRTKDHERTQHLGMDEIESALLSEGIVEAAKFAIRRPRPSPLTGALPHSGYSMPSGHATMTFAAATVLQQHLGYKAAIPTYLIASYVAMSRLHDNVHYASDVVMGAATGIIIGRSVTWHGRNFYASPELVPHGVAITFATF